jgi:hypothetical protein
MASISASWLFLSLLIGGVGLALFVYGKKQERPPQLVSGLALMIYPYFVHGAAAMVGIGCLVLAALWVVLRWGW